MSGTQLEKTIEGKYDDVSYSVKEWAGFPSRYINLSQDQRDLIDAIVESDYKTKKELDISDQIGYINDLTKELQDMSEALMRRYEGPGR